MLLEREQELEWLGRTLAAAAEGHGGAIVLEGPAGIGKTSLVAAARELAARHGLEALAARGGELERDFAYGVVRQLFEARATPTALEGAAVFAAPVVGLAAAGDAAPTTGIFRDDPTAAALHGLYWLTANLAAERPLLVTVDDLHWADAASVRFLAYLARRVEELPVLLVAASRPPVEALVPELVEALAADPAVRRLEPAPLSVEAVAALMASPRLASEVHAATGGNPFLVRAVLDEMGDAGRVPQVGGRAVARFVAQRLARLGDGPERLARAVAVLGTDVEPRHAYALADLDDGGAAEAALVATGVLAAGRPLEFVHPIVRSAVAHLLLPPERARLHLRAAHMLEREGGDAERLAPHLLAADARADPWVVCTLRRAGARSLERGAPEAAVRYLRRALDEPPEAAERPALLAQLGRAEVRAAMPDAAVEHLRQAQALTADPAERALMAQDLAIGLIAPGHYVDAVAMLAQAVEWTRDADPELSRRLEAELLCAARLDPRTLDVAATVYGRVPSRIAGHTPGERMLLAALAHERVLRGGTAAEVAALARRAVDGGLVSEQSGDSGLVMDAHFALAISGALEAAARSCDEALAEVRARGSVIGFSRVSCMRAIVRLAQGALAEAESDARNTVDAGWEAGYRVARMAHGPLVEALVDQGELEAAEAALAAVGELPDTFMLNFVLHARARLRLAQGRRAEAAGDLEELARREAKWRGSNPAVFAHRSLLALALGPGRRATELAREEVELARRFGAAGALGRSLRALGLLTGALEPLEESLAVLEGTPWRLEHARTLVELGAALRRGRRRRDCREPLHAGMELAHACGARALVTRAREELVAAGARPRRIMRTGVDALTASERRVAGMAARGMSNRDIAQALFVTVRTVEVHLTHAYAKLDIASREELSGRLAAAHQGGGGEGDGDR